VNDRSFELITIARQGPIERVTLNRPDVRNVFNEQVIAELSSGNLEPVVDSIFDLADGRAAFDRMAHGGQFGKIVLRVAP